MESITTNNYTIESSTENFRFYKKSKNFFKIRKTSIINTDFKVIILNYLTGWTATYFANKDGNVLADVTALVQTFDNNITLGFTIISGNTTETIDKSYGISDGISQSVVCMLINKLAMQCDINGELPNNDKITLPSKIIRTEEFYDNKRVKLWWSDFDAEINDVYDDTLYHTDIAWSQNVLTIPNCTSFYETELINEGEEDVILKNRWKLTFADKNKRYCYLSFRSIVDNMPTLGVFLELRDFDINAIKTDLQTLGNGYNDFVNGVKISAKVGLSDLSAYDFAYYSTLITFAENITFTDLLSGNEYECTIATNKINVKSGNFGRFDFEIELNIYSNVD